MIKPLLYFSFLPFTTIYHSFYYIIYYNSQFGNIYYHWFNIPELYKWKKPFVINGFFIYYHLYFIPLLQANNVGQLVGAS